MGRHAPSGCTDWTERDPAIRRGQFFLPSPLHSLPFQPLFWALTDSPDYVPHLSGPRKYRLSYSIQSQNFGTTGTDFILEYGRTPDSVVFAKG